MMSDLENNNVDDVINNDVEFLMCSNMKNTDTETFKERKRGNSCEKSKTKCDSERNNFPKRNSRISFR